MALHELTTNAAKYGALSNDAGRVVIGWKLAEGAPEMVRLVWREEGGPPVAPPTRRGFGSRLIERSLAGQTGGEVQVSYEPAGVVCTIVAPVRAPRSDADEEGAPRAPQLA
jgi:two-component sensor histidine kinase